MPRNKIRTAQEKGVPKFFGNFPLRAIATIRLSNDSLTKGDSSRFLNISPHFSWWSLTIDQALDGTSSFFLVNTFREYLFCEG